jgi:hypothetical protein
MAARVEVGSAPVAVRHIQWGPVVGGAISAAALASVLHAFAAAIGLAVSSTAPTWRDASVGLWILSGVYLILVALAAYGLGGYVSGVLRDRVVPGTLTTEEVELRDGLHGLMVWALATLLTTLFILMVATASAPLVAPSAGSAGPSTSMVGESTIAFDIDRLLRGDRRSDAADVTQTRAEVGRILLSSSGHSGVAAEDRGYLARLVASRVGITTPDAERRVDVAIASARNNLSRARHSAVVLAFMVGAAALLGAVAAWFAAIYGGRYRDDTSGSGRFNVFGRRLLKGQ